VDLYLLIAVTENGIACVSVMLMFLTFFHKQGKYSFFVSFIAFALSFIFLSLGLEKRNSSLANWNYSKILCDDQALIYGVAQTSAIENFLYDVYRLNIGYFVACQVFCVIILICSFLHLIGVFPHLHENLTTKHPFFLYIFFGIMSIGYVLVLGLQLYILYNFYNVLDPSEWGFGQIVAATIWLPPVFAYMSKRWANIRDEAKIKEDDEEAELSRRQQVKQHLKHPFGSSKPSASASTAAEEQITEKTTGETVQKPAEEIEQNPVDSTA